MIVNTPKTKAMHISRNEKEQNIYIEGIRVEQVQTFKYLGTMISSNGRVEEDVN